MRHKLDALEENHTWDVTTLPNEDYNQIEGVDYVERYSPVKTVTVRVFLAIASAYEWPLHQLDIKNDFLHGLVGDTFICGLCDRIFLTVYNNLVSFFSTPVTIIVCSFACTQMLESKGQLADLFTKSLPGASFAG
ncbi:UNVERIFIED_CONTAM: hypothetical protein Scaly_2561100 [Sesamum calycinum]|uniref:Reverse transcriptase Ty1/copia-type domain-containing protein n=1 Tax=Sesamum calycinum TaxID=2727403 RepID=A0AAW2KMP6_9LAMI